MPTVPLFSSTASRLMRWPARLVPIALFLLAALSAAAQAPLLNLASPNEVQEGNFGLAVSGARDVDGDGRDDLVVGAPGESVADLSDAGRAYVFSGASGTLLYALASPDPEGFGRFGTGVALIGDVDDDSFPDLLVGAPSEDVDGVVSAGQAYVFSGLTGALVYTLASPGLEDGGNFGEDVAGVGDTDGDGVTDLLVGAFDEEAGGPDGAGRAHLFSGATGAVLYSLASPDETTLGQFGWSVAGAGDLDGDERADLLVGAIGERNSRGRVYAFSGATGALLGGIGSPNAERGGDFGGSVAGVGDANGDGVPDVLVGAEGEDVGGLAEAGRAYLFSGADGALLHTLLSPTPVEIGAFGASVAGAGDQDGDGRADLLVGAYSEEGAGLEESGQAHVFSGSDGSLLYTLVSPTASRFGFFGVAVAFAGDVNGDGAPDVIAGASRETPDGSPVGAGRAHVFGGTGNTAAVTVDIEPVNPPVTIPPGGGSFQFTITLRNTTNIAQTVQVSTAVEGPADRDPVLGPQTVTLAAGASITRTLTQAVPAAAPAGVYTYTANVEIAPGTLLSSDAFAFVKEAGSRLVSGGSGDWSVSDWEAEVSASATGPAGLALSEVYPNPSGSTARLTLDVAEAQAVMVAVYDGLGRRVAVLHDGRIEAGAHGFALDASALAPGVYVVRATGRGEVAVRRLVVAR